MAQVSSGSFTCSGGYEGRTLTFSWSVQSQSIADNTTTISWTLKGSGTTSGFSYADSSKFTVKINGSQVHYSNPSPRLDLYNGTTVATGTYTFIHNSDGSCSFSAYAEGAIYYSRVNTTGSGSWELPKIARQATVISADNFTDEGNPTLTYSVPAPDVIDKLEACIANSTGGLVYISYREVPIVDGNSYTFNLTDAERDVLRNACNTANSMTVRFFVRSTIGENQLLSSVAKTLTITNAAPTIAASVVDDGARSKTLTGNINTMIKGYNRMVATMTATAYKGATITSQKITNGGTVINAASGEFGYTEVNKFVFSATDSRGNTVSKTITVPMIEYVKLTSNFNVDSFTADGTGRLSFSGNYFNGSFGATNNTLAVQYRYKANSGEYSAWIDVEESISGNTYTATADLSGFDYRNTYTFQARAVDGVYNDGVLSAEIKKTIYPIFDWGQNSFSFNMGLDKLSVNGVSLLDLLHPIGSVYISRSAISPADIFGGYWRRIKDRFILAAGDTYASGSTGGEATHTLTVAEMPAHIHRQSVVGTRSGSGSTYVSWNASNLTGSTANTYHDTYSTGGDGAHNNMPPYLTLYVWERIREAEE